MAARPACVARMEEAGLVEREIPKEDRRATYARITTKGTAALERAKPVHLEAVAGALEASTSTRRAGAHVLIAAALTAAVLDGANGVDWRTSTESCA